MKKLNESAEKREVMKRFVKEYRLPINVFEDSYWEYLLNLYDREFNSKDLWYDLLEGIETDYSGDYNKFLDEFYNIREKMIIDLREQLPSNYLALPGKIKDIKNPASPYYDIPSRYELLRTKNIYNEKLADGVTNYTVIDLKKANFQAIMKIIGLGGDVEKQYKKWLSKFKTGNYVDKYVSDSKYLREVVLGNLNPKRQIRVERYLIYKIVECLNINPDDIVQLGNDEVVIKNRNLVKYDTELEIFEELGLAVDVSISRFVLVSEKFITSSGREFSIYRKKPETARSGKGKISEYKSIPGLFYPQIYQWVYDIAPDKQNRDLAFVHEGELSTMLGRIKKKG